ncbi:MAG TPA: ParB N-terminal domain-containing protein [Methylocystis sp.]|jgi:ParB family chromosome partitioning protein
MTAETIAIAEIDASERLRPLDPDTVAAYAAIAEQRIGEGKSPLIQPIIVRPEGEAYKLVAGGHRLACLHEVGVETLSVGVDVVVKIMGTEEAFEDEVFENLANAGLNALDRAIFLAEAKKVADAKRGETRGRKPKIEKLQGDKKMAESAIISSARFTKAAAARIGLSETQVKEAVRIANALDQQAVAEIRGTMIEDNIVELKQLVELAPEQQRNAAAAIKRGEAKRVAEARVVIGVDKPKTDDPQARIYAQLIDLWGKASKRTRANFLKTHGLVHAKSDEAA